VDTRVPTTETVLEAVAALGPPGTPVTTPEVAEPFDCTTRTVYNRLTALTEAGTLAIKKVGARSRVWWRPAASATARNPEADDRLRAVEGKLAVATTAGSVGLWTWDLATDVVVAEDLLVKLFGVDAAAVEPDVRFADYLRGVHEDDVERLQAAFDRARAGETDTVESEFRVRDPDGDWRWVRAYAAMEFDGRGEPVRMNGATVDLTDQKRRKAELRRKGELDAFRVTLGNALRPLSDPVEIQRVAATVLGERLGVDRALYGEVLGDETTRVQTGYVDEHSTVLEGEYDLSEFGGLVVTAVHERDRLVVDDVRAQFDPSAAVLERYEATGVRSYVGVPLAKRDRASSFVVVTHSTPRTWSETEVAMVEVTAERTWDAVERARAEGELAETNAALERLNAASRELMTADVETLPECVAAAAVDVLAADRVVLWTYDDAAGELRETVPAGPGADDASAPPTAVASDVWEAFVGGVTMVLREPDETGRSLTVVPLGRHGALVVEAQHREGTSRLLATLGATVETAWNRAEGECDLAVSNDELRRLDRLNTLFRRIGRSLIEADTQTAVYRAVCERLADSDLYEFAWVTELDPATDALRPRAWAGVDAAFAERLAATPGDDDNAVRRALEERGVQVVRDVVTDLAVESWRDAALRRGARSLVCIPLCDGAALYGVLTVAAGSPHSDDRDVTVLSELGDTVAHRIGLAQTRAALRTESVVEVRLRLAEADTPLCWLARRTGATVVLEGYVSRPDGGSDLFFVVDDCDDATVRAAIEESPTLSRPTRVGGDDGEGLWRVRVSDPVVAELVESVDGVVRSFVVVAGVATLTVDVPHTASVRRVLDRLRTATPDVELVARRTRSRPVKTSRTFAATVADSLTERQREVLQTAYLSGYFESPRATSGTALADSLGVSQPTVSHHLRAAERALCAVLFEAE
jgi:PAS domain S-box-containing protein